VWERVVLKMTSSLRLQDVLTAVTEGLVMEMDGAFARIWLVGPGDICYKCLKVDLCPSRLPCLHLKASSGLSTNLDGEYRRVPIGAMKIGLIAHLGQPLYTNEVMNDDRLPNKQWLLDNALRSFAGYPLMFNGEVLGVLALFSRQVIREEEFERLAVFSHQAAVAVKNAQLFEEVQRLKNQLLAENIYLHQEIELEHGWGEIIGESPALKHALKLVSQVAPTTASVLIQGETGTGKELIARAIHRLSTRKDQAIVKLNCAAIPTGLIESELFGHEKGAFTGAVMQKVGRFELADHGTLFLDEVGDIPLELQAKLLRVLQEQEFERLGSTRTIHVNVRVVAATNRDLAAMVEAKEFRSDLYYRLKTFPILIPPLRHRGEDVPLLVRFFTQKHARQLNKTITRIPSETMAALSRYSWPGNIRELDNFIERCVILSSADTLEVPLAELRTAPTLQLGATSLQDAEREHIHRVLEQSRWVIGGPSGAAAKLGMKRTSLIFKMQKLGITRPR
jgi:formate hydrogenlyase transcriptional activator